MVETIRAQRCQHNLHRVQSTENKGVLLKSRDLKALSQRATLIVLDQYYLFLFSSVIILNCFLTLCIKSLFYKSTHLILRTSTTQKTLSIMGFPKRIQMWKWLDPRLGWILKWACVHGKPNPFAVWGWGKLLWLFTSIETHCQKFSSWPLKPVGLELPIIVAFKCTSTLTIKRQSSQQLCCLALIGNIRGDAGKMYRNRLM